MYEYLSPFMFSREEMKAQARLDNRNLRATREKYEPEDPTYRPNKTSDLEIADKIKSPQNGRETLVFKFRVSLYRRIPFLKMI